MKLEPPYTLDILRLAASLPVESALAAPDGVGTARSVACGSVIACEVVLNQGRIAQIGQKVTACAYGQASAAILQGWTQGRLKAEVIVMRAALRAWLEERGDLPEAWRALAPVAGRPGRHGAVLLPFDALLAALREVE